VRNTDQLLTRLVAEIEEKQQFIDGIVEDAEKDGRDLSSQEMELVTRSRDRMSELNQQLEPVKESRRIGLESSRMLAEIAATLGGDGERPRQAEYRSAGAWIVDYWRAGVGQTDARERLELFMRAAAHQTTPDNPGLLPEQILGPVLQFVDQARPMINALGARQLPSGSWSRPRITQHTQVGQQTAEKTELPSRKLIIGKIPVTAETWGGYVNVSRQNIDWTQPAVFDIVVNDLAAQYAIETENAAADTFAAAATAGPTLPAGPSGEQVAAAVWTAVGQVYAAMQGVGGVLIACSPDMLGLIGPLFAPVNPQNAFGSGFNAANFGQGAMGAVAGISVVVSAGFATGTILVMSTAAAEVYEDRIGSLQVIEPSVLGVQVAYAGYAAFLVIEPTGIVRISPTAGP